MRRQLPLPRLKKKLWKIFSEYIRRKYADKNGYAKCVTCGISRHYKELDAGHYYPAGSSGLLLYFEEKNVHPQCTACNRFRHGNLTEYTIFLIDKYGECIIEELKDMKKLVKWYREDYEKKIDYYSLKLRELNSSIGGQDEKNL